MLFTILLSLSERTTSAGRGRFFHFKYKVKIQSKILFFCGGAPAFFRHCDDPQGTAASHSLLLLSLRGSAGTAASQSLFLLSLRGSAGTAASQSPAICMHWIASADRPPRFLMSPADVTVQRMRS